MRPDSVHCGSCPGSLCCRGPVVLDAAAVQSLPPKPTPAALTLLSASLFGTPIVALCCLLPLLDTAGAMAQTLALILVLLLSLIGLRQLAPRLEAFLAHQQIDLQGLQQSNDFAALRSE